MPSRSTTSRATLQSSTPYSLELMSEYSHTLDSLPLDLSRFFADLRELDAVLTSTVSSVTNKIYKLIDMIENKSASNEQRLWLLNEISEEASRVRPGADDKIRIATQAADNLRTQSAHLTAIASHLPDFDATLFARRTRYPHVSARAYVLPSSFESGRRRRAPNTGGWLGTGDGSPNKRRRVVQEEDLEYGGTGKTPKKDKAGDINNQPRQGRGPRTKKPDRHPSPSESLLSTVSPLPGAHSAGAVGTQRTNGNAHRQHQSSVSSKRRANVHAHPTDASTSLLETVLMRKENQHNSTSGAHHALGDLDHSIHETISRKNGHGHSNTEHTNSHGRAGENNHGVQNQADASGAPGPTARASTLSSLATTIASNMEGSPVPGAAAATPLTVGGDGIDEDIEGEMDDGKTYCICNNVSYGEMIGCDDDHCQREWFHLACIGLAAPPKGEWFCDECTARRNKANKNARSGKKRSGRANGRNGA